MKITNRTVHHECDVPESVIRQIVDVEELGTGTVVTCEECRQHYGAKRREGGVDFYPITKRHRIVLVLFAGTRAYDVIMRMWGPFIDRESWL